MKNQLNFIAFITGLFLLCTIQVQSQSNDDHSLYLLSNLESLSANAPEFDAFQKIVQQEKDSYTILINGDFLDDNGMESPPTTQEMAKIDRLANLVSENGQLLLIPGDREWAEGGAKGMQKVTAIEAYLESKLGDKVLFFPKQGCLGPEILDIGKHLRVVMVNTQWFLQEDFRPEEEDAQCELLNVFEFWEEFSDILADSDNRNLVVAMHHPALSYGQYAGYKLAKQHFSPPIIGSLIAAYRQNVGGPKDLSNEDLKAFTNTLLTEAELHPGAIYVSGHEYDIQVLREKESYHINSGAFAKAKPVAKGKETLYRQNKPGFAKLFFQEDGTVKVHAYTRSQSQTLEQTYNQTLYSNPCESTQQYIPTNPLYNPCLQKFGQAGSDHPKTGTATPGAHYKAGPIKRWVMGKNYRKIWATPVQDIPYLDLVNFDGGLTPYAKGGAAQTLSLKFKTADGRRYAFRSVDKDPTQKVSKELGQGLYGKIVKDITSNQHPYGSVIITSLMDELDLPHSTPTLFLMPDSPALGPFRKEFAHKLGWLEVKPRGKSKKKKRAGFKGADEIVSTLQMYRHLIDDNDNKLDVDAYVTARVFDIWISDWDRHVNNWKWLGYKEDKGLRFTPFPKDRDKALSVLNGWLQVVDWEFVAPDMADFTKKYKGLKSLNFKNRSMDRWLANSYTRDDWQARAKQVQEAMTDQVIEKAITAIPTEVQEMTRNRLLEIFKARRKNLPKVINRYYNMLVKQIDLIGSNSREYFQVNRLKDGNVQVKIYNLKKNGDQGELLFDRLFYKKETKEIRLHGLGKDDKFDISGEASKSILIRIIGGDGVDEIEERSKVSGLRKLTKVYDHRQQDKLELGREGKLKKTPETIRFRSDHIFNYNKLLLFPAIAYNADDGLSIGLTGSIVKKGFNKPDFKSRYNFGGAFTTRNNYNLNLSAQFRHVIHKWDLSLGVGLASRDKSFQRFYGFGNNTKIVDSLDQQRYYHNHIEAFEASIGLERSFWERSSFSTSFVLDYKDVEPDPSVEGGASIYDQLPPISGLGENGLLGIRLNLNIDFRDSPAFPQRGMQFLLRNYAFSNGESDWELGGRIQSELLAYITRGIKIPATLSLRGGFSTVYGDTPFFYRSYLGQQSNHRGFLRNRFGGDTSLFLNTDLRFHFGKIITPLVPIKYGIFGLLDLGRVWSNTEESGNIHSAIGGGIYVVPYVESFNLTFTVARSDEESLLFSFQLGFFVQ